MPRRRPRAALTALFALDARLRAITLAARDPTIGLMRLTWWGDALARLDIAPAPAERCCDHSWPRCCRAA